MISLMYLVSILVSCASLSFLYLKWSYNYWKRRNIPYIEPTIPFGNLENPFKLKLGVGFKVAKLYAEFKRRGCKHGGIFSGTRPIYVPIDLDRVKNILVNDFQHFTDRGFYHNERNDPLSAHLLSIGGRKWKNLRAKLTPVFTSGKVKGMFRTLLDCGEQMREALDEIYLNTKTFNVKEISACFTTDVIGSCAFGIDFNSLKNPSSDFRKFGKKFFEIDIEHRIRNFLALSFPKICGALGMRLYPTDVTSFFDDAIKAVIRQRESNNIERNDFVKLLLQIKNRDGLLTLQEISTQAFLFFLAGFETSSTTMGFCLYQLALNPDVQEKLRREVYEIRAKYGGEITYDGLQGMSYMTQVIEETLRMYPIGPILNRICTKDYLLPDGGTVLERGTKVVIPVYGIHHDPEYYPNPEMFDPNRFGAKMKANRHSFAFLGFGEGPRNCIGMRFGMMQVKTGLAILLSSYKFSLNSETPEILTLIHKSLVIASVEDILLDVEKIQR